MLWLSGWLTGWAAPHRAVRNSVLQAWARGQECAKTNPPPIPHRHHALLSADNWSLLWARIPPEIEEERSTHTHTFPNYIPKHTHTHFSFYREDWYNTEGSEWLIKGLLCARIKIMTQWYTHEHRHTQSHCWEWSPVGVEARGHVLSASFSIRQFLINSSKPYSF